MKFTILVDVIEATGSQLWSVEADTEVQAKVKFLAGDAGRLADDTFILADL